MNDGFVKAAAISTRVTVADPESNCEEVCGGILKAASLGAKIMVFPELCLTGYTCGDLFYHDVLIDEARQALSRIKEYTKTVDAIIFVGCPVNVKGALYNCAVAINRGKIIGVVPKSYLPEYNEFYEKRQFTEAPPRTEDIVLCGDCVPFGQGIVFECDGMPEFTVGAELCEDLWVPMPPSTRLALSGATIIVNLSASNESVGKSEYRRLLVSSQSARLLAGYVYCSAGEGESTTDLVFSGHCMIAENGKILAESKLFDSAVTVSEIDVSYLSSERAKIFTSGDRKQPERTVKFFVERTNTALTRTFMRYPFVPSDGDELFSRSQLILTMQSRALQKRIEHTNAKTLVVGVSGGLDSSLALIVAKTAADAAKNKPRVIAVTMPCFGTTRRTHDNSLKLAKALGVTRSAVSQTLAKLEKKGTVRRFSDGRGGLSVGRLFIQTPIFQYPVGPHFQHPAADQFIAFRYLLFRFFGAVLSVLHVVRQDAGQINGDFLFQQLLAAVDLQPEMQRQKIPQPVLQRKERLVEDVVRFIGGQQRLNHIMPLHRAEAAGC